MASRQALTARDFLIRGLLAGLIAGIAAFAVAYVAGEPSVNAAIAIEESGGDHHHAEPEAPAETGHHTEVPRTLQSTVGLLTGTVVAGVTLGGLAGILSALALGRFGALGARASTLLVTGLGFGSLYVLPFVVYPPNPPAVGHADTITMRTALYFTTVAISVVGTATAVAVGRRLAPRWGSWHAGLAAVGGFVVLAVITAIAMPNYNEVPAEFPAAVLYEFRTASFLTQLTLWGTLGVVLAELTARTARKPAGNAIREQVPA